MFLNNPYVHAAGTLPLTDAFITATSIVDTNIINALNGTLSYESDDNRGTSFKIGLPIVGD